jgi:hypothetical protein
MTTRTVAGVVYTSLDGDITHLPLHDVRVHMLIVDGELIEYNLDVL